MTPLKLKTSFFLTSFSLCSWGLESYQGPDFPLESWMCGAPLVETLRRKDPDNLLNDSRGKLGLKASLIEISENNLQLLRDSLGSLSDKEKNLVDLIATKFNPPIVHRASVPTSRFILTSTKGLESATKRGAAPRGTPVIEQYLFSGHDCLFTSVASPYGIKDYGTVILRFEDKKGFSWGSMYTGFRWGLEVEKADLTKDPGDGMRRRFARQIFTNNHWDEALALFIIENVRAGTTFRGKGAAYDKKTIIDSLLAEESKSSFWSTVVRHRLAFLEGHYTDNFPVTDLSFVQYRLADKSIVESWGLSPAWFGHDDAFIQYFNRLD